MSREGDERSKTERSVDTSAKVLMGEQTSAVASEVECDRDVSGVVCDEVDVNGSASLWFLEPNEFDLWGDLKTLSGSLVRAFRLRYLEKTVAIAVCDWGA